MMYSQCTISRPGPQKQTYDPATRRTTTSGPTPYYTGPCRLWQVSEGGKTWTQDREVAVTRTFMSIPYTATVEPGDRVTVTAHDDPDMVGRSLIVEAVRRAGDLRGSRVMRVQFTDYEEEGDA